MWSEGVIGIPDAKDKEKYTKCHYWVKHYDEPSETYGINGGRISEPKISEQNQDRVPYPGFSFVYEASGFCS